MKQYDSGVRGEQAAEQWLCQQGMTCLDRRYRAADGEIDLVMQDHDMIVFVEVKYRPTGHAGDGLFAVTKSKQRRTTHAALAWMVHHQMMNASVRFDVVEITHDGVAHVRNAWTA